MKKTQTSRTRRRRKTQRGGGNLTPKSNVTASSLARKIFVDVPMRMTDKLVTYVEDVAGLNSAQSTDELTKKWRAKAGILSTVAKDPIIVKNVTDTLRQSSDILVKTIDEAGPKITSAGSNVIQAVPLYGNIVSILRAVAEGSDAAAKLSSRMVEAGVLGMDSVNRIRAGAKRLHQLASVGDEVDRAGQSLVNRGIHAVTNMAETSVHHGLDKLDNAASGQVGGGKQTARSRAQMSLHQFLYGAAHL